MRNKFWFRELVAATALILAALAAFGSALLVGWALGAGTALPVLAVVVTLTLGRVERGADRRQRLAGIVRLPLVAVGAGLVGTLLRTVPPLGAALFVLGLSGAVWLRRFGTRGRTLGRLLTLPLIAMLVTPVPATALTGQSAWKVAAGGALAALLAAAWVTTVHLVGQRLGWLAGTPSPAIPSTEIPAAKIPAAKIPAAEVAAAGPARVEGLRAAEPAPKAPTPAPAPARRVLPSTRMALQLAVALTLAFGIGRSISSTHWVWVVLTAFIVSSGNRGRGDVVWKGLLRLLGAVLGTVLATGVGHLFGPGDRAAIAVIFVVLWLAAWLRSFNYAYWAAGITAALAVLYSYYGEGGADLLGERLGGILLGAIIAVAAAWLVLPVRTSDVARRGFANALAALSELLAALPDADGTRFFAAMDSLAELAPPIRAHRRAPGRRPTHLADAIDALERCVAPVQMLLNAKPEVLETVVVRRRLAAARKAVGAARRALAGRAEPTAAPTPVATRPATADAPPTIAPMLDLPPTATALAAIGDEMSVVRAVWLAIPRRNSAVAGVASPPAQPRSGAAPA